MHQNNMRQITQAAETTAHFLGGFYNATYMHWHVHLDTSASWDFRQLLNNQQHRHMQLHTHHLASSKTLCFNPMFQLMHAQPPSDL
jgi:hypothetical protein